MSTQSKKTTVHAPNVQNGDGTLGQTIEVQQHQVNLPYPPPQILVAYNTAIGGLGDKVVDLIDRENAHRHARENKMLDADIRHREAIAKNERLALLFEFVPRFVGQIFAFFLCITFGGAGVWLAMNGKELPGAIIGTGGLIGLAWVFINGKPKSEAKVTPRTSSKRSGKKG
jgi:uncharacterized membrane protein